MTDEFLVVRSERYCWTFRYTSRIAVLIAVCIILLYPSTGNDVHRKLRSKRDRGSKSKKSANALLLLTPTQRFHAGDRPSPRSIPLNLTSGDGFREHNYRAYSQACIRFESPLYGSGTYNGLAITRAVEQKFTTTPVSSPQGVSTGSNQDSHHPGLVNNEGSGGGKWTMTAELWYGMAPNLHMFHPLQSLLPAIDFYIKHRAHFRALVLPSDFLGANGHGNVTMRGIQQLYPFINILVVAPGNDSTCHRNLVIMGSMGELPAMKQNLGQLARQAWIAGCHLPPHPAHTPHPVLLYNRSPLAYGNVRFVTNMIDVDRALQRRAVTSDVYVQRPNETFCEQVATLYKTYRLVIAIHGNNIIPLVMLPSGATIIEILPRTYCKANFCEMAHSNNMTLVHYGQGDRKYRFYHWCDEKYLNEKYAPRVMCDGVRHPKPVLDEQVHQGLLHEMPYFDGEEVEGLVKWVVGRMGGVKGG